MKALMYAGFILIALAALGCFVAAGVMAGQEHERAVRCTADGGVLVESGESLSGDSACIDQSVVIW
jgi:hypothetical protein